MTTVDEVANELASFLVIRLRGTPYCLEMSGVRSVLDVGPVTRVPGAPRSVAGVLNVGGRALALGDLAVALGEEATPIGERTTAVVLDARDDRGEDLAVLADIVDVVELGRADMEAPPSFGLGTSTPFVQNVARLPRGGVAFVLDIDRLLDAFVDAGAS